MVEPGSKPIAHQHTVVDVHPASRFGASADVATVRTSILVEGDPAPLDLIAREPVFAQDNRYRISVRVPPEYGSLVKGATFSVVIVLPTVPGIEVELIEWTREPEPQLFDGKGGPRMGGRIGIAWTGSMDPDLDAVYKYLGSY